MALRLQTWSPTPTGALTSRFWKARRWRLGAYELVFEAGAYFDRLGLSLPDPKFLDQVVIRFGIDDPAAHYHVPLLLSPFGYSTYRGS